MRSELAVTLNLLLAMAIFIFFPAAAWAGFVPAYLFRCMIVWTFGGSAFPDFLRFSPPVDSLFDTKRLLLRSHVSESYLPGGEPFAGDVKQLFRAFRYSLKTRSRTSAEIQIHQPPKHIECFVCIRSGDLSGRIHGGEFLLSDRPFPSNDRAILHRSTCIIAIFSSVPINSGRAVLLSACKNPAPFFLRDR